MKKGVTTQIFRNIFIKNCPYAYGLFLNLFVLVYRFSLTVEDLNFINGLTLFSIFVQLIALLFMVQIKKKLKKKYYIIHVFSLYFHLIHVYFIPIPDFKFFIGMETIIIIYVNIREIHTRIIRFAILGTVLLLFLKKETEFDIHFGKFIYLCILLFIFDFSIKNQRNQEEIKRNPKSSILKVKTPIPSLIKTPISSLIKTPISSNISLIDSKNILSRSELNALNDQKLTSGIFNLINVGVLLMDQELNLIFKNNFSSELFKIDDQTELKNLVCSLEENIDFNESDYYKIPAELRLKEIFQNSLQFIPTLESMDEVFAKFEFKKLLLEEVSNSLHSRPKSNTIMHQMEKRESIFKGWNQKNLKENLDSKFLDSFKSEIEKKKPKSVLNYLKKLLEYYTEPEKNNENFEEESLLVKEIQNFSMYARFPTEEKFFLLNFYPLKNNEKNITDDNFKILITIRELSELEKKHLGGLNSKSKMLGSFCHELRTPINGLINMLDLMHSHIDEVPSYNFFNGDFKELLSNCVVSSHLLLNQIDDFIDYFSFCNEMLELHVGPFHFQSFMSDINRVISFVALKKNISFSIEIDDNIPEILFNDNQKLKRIIYNLINNSIRYTNSGGLIKVCAKLRKQNYIRISVFDTGSGIKDEELSFLGKISNNSKDLHKNTCGFGLFICNILCLMIDNGLSEKKKGLTVYSEHGMGTCFSFNFRCDMNLESVNFEEKSNQNLFSISSSEYIGPQILTFNSKEKIFISNAIDETQKKKYLNKSFEKIPIKIDELISKREGNFKFFNKEPINSNLKAHTFIDSTFGSLNDCKCMQVLIVDDISFNIEACSRLLNKFKILSDSANNGLDAVDKIASLLDKIECSTAIDMNSNYGLKTNKERRFCSKCKFYKLILMDVDMPVKNGIEATEEIVNLLKNTDFSVSIVGLSAFDQEDIVRRGKEAGMIEYVTKPIKAEKMKELISKYVLNK